jgi:hypothetical protein
VLVDPAANVVGETMKEPTVKMFQDMNTRFRVAPGGGADDAIDFEQELSQDGFAATSYYVWARRTAQ